jgi:magnesium transporter
MIRSFYYLPSEGVQVLDDIQDFDRLLAVEGAVLWIDMLKPTDQELFILTHDFKFHPLAIEDVIAENSRTKVDDYDRYLFMVFPVVDYVGREHGLKISELNFFLGKNYLLSVRFTEHRMFDYLYGRAERDERLISRGADYLIHAVIDTVVDNYNSTLDIFDYEVDRIEQDVLATAGEETLRSIFSLRRDVIALKRVVGPQKEVVNHISRQHYSLVTTALTPYFSDIHDHLLRINEIADSHQQILTSSLEIYYSSVSTRTGEIIKVLTILTAIFIPPTFLVGLWGMNFRFMPEIDKPWGYGMAIGVIALTMGSMLLYFWRKKWL